MDKKFFFGIVFPIWGFIFFLVWFMFSPIFQRRIIKERLGKGKYWRVNKMPKRCWINSLEMLNKIKNDPNIVGATHCTGYIDKSLEGHSWIEYGIKTENGIKHIAYDPTFDRIITYKNVKKKINRK